MLQETQDRFHRQQDLIPRTRLETSKPVVIGVGAIGRQVALQLAAIGAPTIMVIDLDKVEDSNITTQMYLQKHLGMEKVDATEDSIKEIDPNIEVIKVGTGFTPRLIPQNNAAVFCCVDSIEVRTAIWKCVLKRKNAWFGDARMLGEILRILSCNVSEETGYYDKTLFKKEQAESGRCTARSTVYTAGIAAGLLLHQFTRHLRGIPLESDMLYNLLSNEQTFLLENS